MHHNQPPNSKKQLIQPLAMQDRLPKRWLLAKKLFKQSTMQLTNETIESQFLRTLAKVKKLLSSEHPTAFERDYRNDNSNDAFAMHAFMTGTFYFHLECNFTYNYDVTYAFSNCEHEATIRELLKCYPLCTRAKEVSLQPNFTTYFGRVLNVQDDKYIHPL